MGGLYIYSYYAQNTSMYLEIAINTTHHRLTTKTKSVHPAFRRNLLNISCTYTMFKNRKDSESLKLSSITLLNTDIEKHIRISYHTKIQSTYIK